jgi:amino acid adenylation domain-containing protein
MRTSEPADNLAAGFLENARRAPGNLAVRVADRSVTYGDLAEESGRIATWLLRSGAEGRVAVLGQRSARLHAAILGAAAAGLPYVPIGVDLPVERQIALLQRSGARILLADRAVHPRLRDAASAAVLSPEDDAALGGMAPLASPLPVRASDEAYLIFTSGTTGVPKAVRVSVGNVRAFLRVIGERLALRASDRVSQFFEPTFDPFVEELFGTLGAGASLHVMPDGERMAPGRFLRAEGITVWLSVPSVLAFMARTRQLAPGSYPALRLAVSGGEPLPLTAVKALRAAAPGCEIENQYGPTEATVACTAERIGAAPRVTEGRGIVAIGRPFPGIRAAVVGDDGAFLPRGEKGELALHGAQLALGYDDEALTARRFPTLVHPEFGPGRWYLTGDLAREDEDGAFHHLGRVDHQVKLVGHRVELGDVEAHLRAAAGVDAVVVPWPAEDGVARGLVAFLAAGDWDPVDVQASLARTLPPYMLPKRIVPLPMLPLTANGKHDRSALARSLAEAR